MNRQRLSYQQQTAACWITSVLNGMVFLLGSGTRIPNIIARMLYSISSRDGTVDTEADQLVRILNNAELNVRGRIERGRDLTPSVVTHAIGRGACVVADTLSGRHTVLIVGRRDREFLLFDPDWENIHPRPHSKPGRYAIVLDQPLYNVRVSAGELFKRRRDRFSMGAVSERYGIVMSRARPPARAWGMP
jgi:hypothetical protein